LFFEHDFSTRNARKLIKCSKDSDYGLVSNINLIQMPRATEPEPKWTKTTK